MANVVTASKDQVDWAIGVLDKAGEGEAVEAEEFFKATAVLTVVVTAAFDLAEEVERLRAEVRRLKDKANRFLDSLENEGAFQDYDEYVALKESSDEP